MININEQNELFNLIGAKLDDKIECLAIGGSAMMFYGAKTETKDIDLVFLDKKSFDKVKKVLFEIGFNEKKNIQNIFPYIDVAENKPIMMDGLNTRFDLFLKEVIGFKLSDSIINRVKEIHEFNNLVLKIISPEDIILLKCATEREKDRNDAASLIKNFKINWDIIINESINQTEIGGDLVPVLLFDFLYELDDGHNITIPKEVIKRIRKIGEKMMIEKLKSKKHIKCT